MLLEKYKPRNLREILGQKSALKEVVEWLNKWKKGNALIICGPIGTGKTIIAETIAKEKGYNLIKLDENDFSQPNIKDVLTSVTRDESLVGKRLILIDSADELNSKEISEIIKIIKDSFYPIIITVRNIYDSKLKRLKSICKIVRLRKISSSLIEKKLLEIARKERMKISREVIRMIAKNCNGDLRSAINDLEASFGSLMEKREREVNIFEVLRAIFHSSSIEKTLKLMNDCDKDIDEIFWWVEENICKEFKNPKEIAEAFEMLSKIDLLRNKIIKTQNFRFRSYMKSLIAGLSTLKKERYGKFIPYQPPSRIIMLGRTKNERKKEDEIYSQLGRILHCSKRKVKEQLPYLKMILGNTIDT